METVGKLAGGIAHEFNSIMTAIIGHCEMMLAIFPPENPLRKNACEIHQAADRAAALTRQLLAYGRKQILQPDPGSEQRPGRMEGTLRHLMGRDVDVRIVPAAGPQGRERGPRPNGASHREHGHERAPTSCRTAANSPWKPPMPRLDQEYVSHFPDLKAGDYVMLAMTDTGPGMSPEVKERIFEPFFTTKGVGKGTGLGLATCYGILKQSGGHINVYSEPGRGATFKIYLPQARRRRKFPARLSTSPGLERGTETILLVEDDPALREMAATLLLAAGLAVLTAGDGLEALNVKHQRATGHIDCCSPMSSCRT